MVRRGRTTEELGVDAVSKMFRKKGCKVRDRSREKVGYDLDVRHPHGKWQRIEVKAGAEEGWPEIDVRKSCRIRWSNGSDKVRARLDGFKTRRPSVRITFNLAKPNFDEVYVVENAGHGKRQQIYHYTLKDIQRHGDAVVAMKVRIHINKRHRKHYRVWRLATSVGAARCRRTK